MLKLTTRKQEEIWSAYSTHAWYLCTLKKYSRTAVY